MARPGQATLHYTEGDDESYVFHLRTTSGVPVSLVGSIVRMEARRAYDDPQVVVLTIVMPDPVSGSFTARLSAAQTRVMAGNRYLWDVQTTTSDQTRTLVKGTFNGCREVTV